jgi:hypothetical protein
VNMGDDAGITVAAPPIEVARDVAVGGDLL